MSIILGTVALSYGSVPMYKMVRSYQPTDSLGLYLVIVQTKKSKRKWLNADFFASYLF